MTRIAIIGYASLDHVALLDGSPLAGRTTTIVERPEGAWPRLGGGPAYVAAALVAQGITEAYPVTWVGADEAGQAYRRRLREQDIMDDGVVAVDGARTPVAVLAYEPDGGCICLYDPGVPSDLMLSDRQKRLIAEAEWVAITIGPPLATAAALELLPATSRLAWIVKHDPRALPLELAQRLARRADLICCSRAEHSLLAEALGLAGDQRPERIVIETSGREGAAISMAGSSQFLPAAPVSVVDPTGAGDTFAGGVLAALARGVCDPSAIVQSGHDAARRLLEARQQLVR